VLLQIGVSILLGGISYFIIWLLLPGGYKSILEFASYPLAVLKNKKKTVIEVV
jgi:hypothetical protein